MFVTKLLNKFFKKDAKQNKATKILIDEPIKGQIQKGIDIQVPNKLIDQSPKFIRHEDPKPVTFNKTQNKSRKQSKSNYLRAKVRPNSRTTAVGL
jgi:hypothetical protein